MVRCEQNMICWQNIIESGPYFVFYCDRVAFTSCLRHVLLPQFMKKGTFMDNFDVNGGNGGGIANGGTLTFNLRAIFRK